jgi:thiosulfate/3-mercaptopyruvate sulfurtransferase
MYSTLISASDLVTQLSNPHWAILDCRFDLADTGAGERAFRTDHIPGAQYAHLDRDLSAARTANTGRHPLPAPERFADTLGAWGISNDTQVVAYDADNGAYAARLWWMLRWLGHRAVAVLDGGYKAWRAAGLPVATEIAARPRASFLAHANRAMWLDADETAERVSRADWRVLDARAPQRYAGEIEPIDPVAGHVPGARNHPFTSGLGADGRFLSAEQLRARLDASQAGVADDHTVVMCGSGVTACHLLLALEIAGKRGARLYAGSWSEWITDPSRGVAKGTE